MIRFDGRRGRLTSLAVVATAALALMLLAGCSGTTPNTLAVNAVMADPSAYSGRIAIKGVVQNVDAKTSSITLIDETEYATCGLTPCNTAGLLPLSLPIGASAQAGAPTYEGTLPVLKDVVVVVGEIKSTANGPYFDIERLERNGSVLVSRK